VSHPLWLVWSTIVMSAIQVACTGDLPLPQPGNPASTGVVVPTHGRLPTSEESAAVLLMRIRPIVGMQPAECGQHFLTAGSRELELSLKCGRAAARAKRPLWTFKEAHGIDSWTGEGLLGGPDGLIQHFSYDSSPSGDPWNDSKFRLTISPCPRPSVGSRNGQATFACIPGA
jgi:hypothetical protein